jgi:hypothetical protein
MFIGHYAIALAAKRAAPKVSLGTLVLSAQLVDLLWPLFLLLGLEHVRLEPGNTAVTPLDFYDYPFTHSLVGSLCWSLAAGAVFYIFRRDVRVASLIGLTAFSHWILDLLTHRPDLPLGIGDTTYFGLGLWNSQAGTLAVELTLYIAGLALYLKTTAAKDRIGLYGFWALVVTLVLIYLGNLFGPPPPSESVIAVVGNAAWLFVIWAYWIDGHRSLRTS